MTTQSEQQLEEQLIIDLQKQGYEYVPLRTEKALLANLKQQIEKINNLPVLSDAEWKQILYHLKSGTVFEKAEKLRDGESFTFDDGTKTPYIKFLFDDLEKNTFQVTNQIVVENRKRSRFDVTILINGLPLIQMELKKRGGEIAEAFKQTLRYAKDAYSGCQGLFGFIQLFVISNGANTRYYANGTKGMEFVFKWTDEHNKAINDIEDFTPAFLTKSHLLSMLTHHMVLNQSGKFLMVLRPYQVYAVNNIIRQVKTSDKNGYIWHTTGAGKTLTSFQACKVLRNMPEVEKILFIVDRKDLDSQTNKEFTAFQSKSTQTKDSNSQAVNDVQTPNTKLLVKSLKSTNTKLIITTLQKLNKAVSDEKYLEDIEYLQDKKVVLIFDECHRSQFGDTHRKIKKFFAKAQMFGFTGTPILKDNSTSKGGLQFTTKYLFDEPLHKYLIVDAIRDRNVLPFRMHYYGKYTSSVHEGEEVERIDTKEIYEQPKRLTDIATFILDEHDTFTSNRRFTAIFCVSSIPVLIKYYDLFEKLQREREHKAKENGQPYTPLNIVAIFSADDDIEENTTSQSQSKKDKLEAYIKDYNNTFGTNFDADKGFSDYQENISERVKGEIKDDNNVDILLVVNMYLTGFSAPPLNTMYVDKNLKQHGLIQAFSRTNRLVDETKPFGNIVCFRNLKLATDEALQLFANKDSQAYVFVPSFDTIKSEYDNAIEALLNVTPDYKTVDDLLTEEEQAEFIFAFRNVIRLHNQLSNFIEYDQDNTALDKQAFNNFSSKYKDLKSSITSDERETTSVLNDIDFQLELLHRDKINVGYLVNLLQYVVDATTDENKDSLKKQAMDMLGGEISLHDKKELIQKFIDENIPKMITGESVQEAFAKFWDVEKEREYQKICEEQKLKESEFKTLLKDYETAKRLPRSEDMPKLANYTIDIFERTKETNRLMNMTHNFIHKYYDGMKL